MLFRSRGENRETKNFQRMALIGAVANRLLRRLTARSAADTLLLFSLMVAWQNSSSSFFRSTLRDRFRVSHSFSVPKRYFSAAKRLPNSWECDKCTSEVHFPKIRLRSWAGKEILKTIINSCSFPYTGWGKSFATFFLLRISMFRSMTNRWSFFKKVHRRILYKLLFGLIWNHITEHFYRSYIVFMWVAFTSHACFLFF